MNTTDEHLPLAVSTQIMPLKLIFSEYLFFLLHLFKGSWRGALIRFTTLFG